MNFTILDKQEFLTKINFWKKSYYAAEALYQLLISEYVFITINDISILNKLFNYKNHNLSLIFSNLEKHFKSDTVPFQYKKVNELSLYENELLLLFYVRRFDIVKSSHMANIIFLDDIVQDHRTKLHSINNINEFITQSLFIPSIREEDFLCFINIIDNNKHLNLAYFSYIHNSHIAFFCHKVEYFLNKIPLAERYLKGQKKGYFYSKYNNFLKLLSNETLLFLSESCFNIKTAINYNGETNSHYIQGAYLTSVIGQIGYCNNNEIYLESTKNNNPYARHFFYGKTKDISFENNLEKQLSFIETKFKDFIIYITEAVQDGSYYNKKSFYNFDNKLSSEHAFIIMFNYIRTPSFLEDLFHSYLKFLFMNNEKILDSILIDYGKSATTCLYYVDSYKFFKNFQLSILQICLELFQNEKLHLFIDVNYLMSKIDFSYFPDGISVFFIQFFSIVLSKISKFYSTKWRINIYDSNIDGYTNNLFILKNYINNEKELFEDAKPFQIAYYPIFNNKIILLKNSSYLEKDFQTISYYENKIKNKNSDIMIDQSRVPFIVYKK